LDGKIVLLVDDVLYTGRSIRAALNAISDLGRPAIVRLAILVDRGGREMPIAADYVGLKVTSTKSQEVQVFFEPEQRVDLIEVLNVTD
jgi:pyrimidine operon attenuation protein/uracil phosphoribosyltransferase